MTENDKKLFDEIYKSDKYLKNVSAVDLLRSAGRCDRLFNYMQSEGVNISDALDVKKYMHFAYWLGVIEGRNNMKGR